MRTLTTAACFGVLLQGTVADTDNATNTGTNEPTPDEKPKGFLPGRTDETVLHVPHCMDGAGFVKEMKSVDGSDDKEPESTGSDHHAASDKPPRWTARTEVQLCWVNSGLQVSFQAKDDNALSDNSNYTKCNSRIFNQEAVEMFIAPGAEDPTKYIEIDVSPNNVRFIAEVTKPLGSWDNSTTTYFPRSCTPDKPCDCWEETSGITSNVDKNTNTSSYSGNLFVPWRSIGHNKAGNSIPRTWRANFYRIAIQARSKLNSKGECPTKPNGACAYGAWVPTGSMSFHNAAGFGTLILDKQIRDPPMPLQVPHCDDGSGAVLRFKDAESKKDYSKPTNVRACWDKEGMKVKLVAGDDDGMSEYTKCNSPIYNQGAMEMVIAPGAENPTKYTQIGVSPNSDVRYVAEVGNSTAVGKTKTYFPRSCTPDNPCDCSSEETSGITSNSRKFAGTRGRPNSWASTINVPWASIGATEADLPTANEGATFRGNFRRIAIENKTGLADGRCPQPHNGACIYGAWVSSDVKGEREEAQFGTMILKPRYGGYRCPAKSYITTDDERPTDLNDCACYSGYEDKDGKCEKKAEEEEGKPKELKDGEATRYTCPPKSYVAKKAHFPLKGFADCECQWGTARFAETGECVEVPQAEMYQCPEKSFIKLGAQYPLTNFSDCDCYAGYMKGGNEISAGEVHAVLADERHLGAVDEIDTSPSSSSGGRCVPMPKPDPSSTAVALACPAKSYISASYWPITDIARDCLCTWGYAMDEDKEKCITKEAMEQKVAAAAKRNGKRYVAYQITVVFKAGVTCAEAKKYMQLILEALKKAMGVENMFVTSSTCSPVTSRRLTDADATDGGMELTLGGLNEIEKEATALPDTASSEVVQNTLANTGVQLATQPSVQSETLNADGTPVKKDDDTSSSGSSTSSNDVAIVGIVSALVVAIAALFAFSRRNNQRTTFKQQELGVVGEARDAAHSTVDTL